MTTAARVLSAVDGRDDVVLVGQSMGGSTGPVVAERRPVSAVVLLNAMVPVPGETAGAWWEAVGAEAARVAAARHGGYAEEFDLDLVPGGHLAALSHPGELTAYLLGVAR